MRLLDVNLLLYAYFPQYPQHAAARCWLEGELTDGQVGIPWVTLLGFTRIASNARLFEDPPSVGALWSVVGTWLALRSVSVPVPTAGHHALVAELLEHAPSSRDLTDVHLAALAIEHGMVLCSADRGFGRFPRLRWENPLGR